MSQTRLGRPIATSGAETAERIRLAATRLFHTKGYMAATIRDIAESSELTPGAIYNYFGSKQDILYAVVSWSYQALERELESALTRASGEPRGRLRGALVALVLWHIAFPEAARVANRDYEFLHQPRRSWVIAGRRRVRSLFQRLIAEGVADGNMRVPGLKRGGIPLGTELAAMSLINMSLMVAEWYRPGGPLSEREIADYQADLGLQVVGCSSPMG